MTVQDTVLIVATGVVAVGLALILWRELTNAGDRRRVGPLRDVIEVLLPVVATVGLLVWAWVV